MSGSYVCADYGVGRMIIRPYNLGDGREIRGLCCYVLGRYETYPYDCFPSLVFGDLNAPEHEV